MDKFTLENFKERKLTEIFQSSMLLEQHDPDRKFKRVFCINSHEFPITKNKKLSDLEGRACRSKTTMACPILAEQMQNGLR
jgi:hypothetical protein